MRRSLVSFPKFFSLFLLLVLASFAVWSAAARNQGGGAAPASTVALNPSKLPDISGLHLGIPLADATALMKKMYPRGVGVMNGGPLGPQNQTAVDVLRAQGDGRDIAGVD